MRACVVAILVVLLVQCAPPPDPNRGLDRAVPVALSPDNWMRKYKIEESSGILVFALDVAAPGTVRVEGMPAGRSAWIEVRERGLRLARSESLHAVSHEDMRPGRELFVFVPTDAFREFPREIALVYDPAWSAAEEEIGAVERALRDPDANLAALFERIAAAAVSLGEPRGVDDRWTDELRFRSERLVERIAAAQLEERLAEAYAAIDRGDWEGASFPLRTAYERFVPHVSGAKRDESESRIVRAGFAISLVQARGIDELAQVCGPQLGRSKAAGWGGATGDTLRAICRSAGMNAAGKALTRVRGVLIFDPQEARRLVDSLTVAAVRFPTSLKTVPAEPFLQVGRGDLHAEMVAGFPVSFDADLEALRGAIPRAEQAREADHLSAQQWQDAEEAGRRGAHAEARQKAKTALASAREAQQLWTEIQARVFGPVALRDGSVDDGDVVARLEGVRERIEAMGAWIGVWEALLGTQEQVREWNREIAKARQARFAELETSDLQRLRGRMLEVADEVERRMQGMVAGNIRREFAWEAFRQADAALAQAGEQARDSARVLGLAIVKSGTDPTLLDRAGARELVGYHQLAGELLAAGLPESDAGLMEQTRALFERRIVEQTEERVDALAKRGEWAQAEAAAQNYRSFFPGEVSRLELELALRKAENFLEIARADSVRLFSQRALENYRTARAALAGFVDFSVDAKVHYDIASGAIERIERKNLEVLELTVEKRALREVIGDSQLPLEFPVFIVIGKERFGIEGAGEGDAIFNYDIELIIPEDDFARLDIRPQTAVEDPKKPIRTITTRRYDGKVSYVLKTSDFTRSSSVRIAVDGGDVGIEAIAENWIIRLGKQI